MKIHWLKINSVHLSSAKRICPNSWVLESWVFDFEHYLFPYRAYESHKNDCRNLTQNSSGLLKDWWSICLCYFFFVSIHGRREASIAYIFRQSAGYVRRLFPMLRTTYGIPNTLDVVKKWRKSIVVQYLVKLFQITEIPIISKEIFPRYKPLPAK